MQQQSLSLQHAQRPSIRMQMHLPHLTAAIQPSLRQNPTHTLRDGRAHRSARHPARDAFAQPHIRHPDASARSARESARRLQGMLRPSARSQRSATTRLRSTRVLSPARRPQCHQPLSHDAPRASDSTLLQGL